MAWFGLRQFVAVSFFVQAVVVAAVVGTVLQWLGALAWGADAGQCLVRASVVGMWTAVTFSAGSIGFERRRGTLVQLVATSERPLVTLELLVLAASLFGLVAFPVSALTWALLSGAVPPLANPAAALLLWAGSASVSWVVAGIFVLTPRAIAYEGLLLVPVMYASGVLVPLERFGAAAPLLRVVNPVAVPAELLYGARPQVAALASWVVACALWVAAAAVMGRVALDRARVEGSLDLV